MQFMTTVRAQKGSRWPIRGGGGEGGEWGAVGGAVEGGGGKGGGHDQQIKAGRNLWPYFCPSQDPE